MNRLKAGAVLLSVWSGLNLLVAVVVTAVTLFGRTTPVLSLVLTPSEIARVDAKAVAIINAQAAACNPCIAALCVLVLVIVWRALMARARWAFEALVACLVPLQAAGFASDAFVGHRDLGANVVSTAVLFTGLALAGLGLRRRVENTLDSAGGSD